jgi:GAF domain-containing protein
MENFWENLTKAITLANKDSLLFLENIYSSPEDNILNYNYKDLINFYLNRVELNLNQGDLSNNEKLDGYGKVIQEKRGIFYFIDEDELKYKNSDNLIIELKLKDKVIGYVLCNLILNEFHKSILIDLLQSNLEGFVYLFSSLYDLEQETLKGNYCRLKFESYKKAFYDISKAILSSLNIDLLLNIICNVSRDLLLCSGCLILFRDKVVYSVINELIEQDVKFIIPAIKHELYNDKIVLNDLYEVRDVDDIYVKYVKKVVIKNFNVPGVGRGAFVLLYSTDFVEIDDNFISIATNSIATAIETRILFEQLGLKNNFLEKLFIASTSISEALDFEELFNSISRVLKDILNSSNVVIFLKTKTENFKPTYINFKDSRLINFIEESSLSVGFIDNELINEFIKYRSFIFYKDFYKSDLTKFFDLILSKPYMLIPIVQKGNLEGLVLTDLDKNLLENYLNLIKELSDHLAILFSTSFVRVNIYQKLLSKSKEGKIINRIIFEYSSKRELNSLINDIVKEVNLLIPYSIPVFISFKSNVPLILKTLDHYKSLISVILNNLPTSIRNKLRESVNNLKPFIINDFALFIDDVNIYGYIKSLAVKSLVVIPINTETSNLEPVLLVFSLKKKFEEEDIELLLSLGSYFGVFFENASIYAFLQERLIGTQMLYDFLQIITSVLDPINVINNLFLFIKKLLNNEVFIFIQKKYNNYYFPILEPSNLAEKINIYNILNRLGYLGLSYKPIFINQNNSKVNKDYNLIWEEFKKIPNIVNIIILPIVYVREILGYIIIGTSKGYINEITNFILDNISFVVSTPLKNSIILQEQVEISNIIRQALLTNIDTKYLARKYKIDIFYKHISSREITADWVEIIEAKDNRGIIFIIADVSGKGAKSAIYTAQAKYAAKALFSSLDNFELAVNELNKILTLNISNISDINIFITMFALKLYKEDNRIVLEYISAGHEPAIIKYNDSIITLTTNDIPLCIDHNHRYTSKKIDINKDSFVFLYTDGVIDIKNPQGNIYGRDNLLNFIKHNSFKDSKDFCEKVYINIMKHFSEPLQNPGDDITILAIKV